MFLILFSSKISAFNKICLLEEEVVEPEEMSEEEGETIEGQEEMNKFNKSGSEDEVSLIAGTASTMLPPVSLSKHLHDILKQIDREGRKLV